MRTQEEIVKKIEEEKGTSLFGFFLDVLVGFLDFEHAKQFLKSDAKPNDWTPRPNSRDTILKDMSEYMEFAWGKVEDHRGISASRSIQKMDAWLWLLGDEDIIAAFESADYPNYGAPKLAVICRAYDFPIPESDQISNMIEGKRCGDDDSCGCGN